MTQYIPKSALVEEIERRKEEEVSYDEDSKSFASWADENHYSTLESIKNFIDTLEVKEVDLEKEIKKVQCKYKTIEEYEGYPCTMYANNIELIAKHFFELGLKVVQKGERI